MEEVVLGGLRFGGDEGVVAECEEVYDRMGEDCEMLMDAVSFR